MSAVSRVSAFAKRRRLNDDSVVRASESDSSSTTSLLVARASKSRKNVARPIDVPRDVRQVPSRDEVDAVDVTNGASENSFEPLVSAKAVAFIGTREIEQHDGNGCKIRLSRGQKCTVHGITRLWVREGAVYVNGALLRESASVYTVFFSGSGSFTDIIARSKIAEFHLESIQSTNGSFPSVINVPGKLSEQARNGAMSFHVLGQDDDDTSRQDNTSDIDVQIRRMLPYLPNTTNMKDPRVLICGKRSTDTYRASVSLINHLLTDSTHDSVPSSAKKVAFLDLDSAAPAFSAPGTISVAILQTPILGTPYAQPLQQHPSRPNMVVALQYIGAVETSEVPKIDPNCISTLLSTAKEAIKDQILVVRTGSWLANMTQSERSQIHKLLRISIAVCIDPNKASPYYDVAQTTTVENSSNTFFHIPVSPYPTSSLSEHKLMLQSHFRFLQYVDEMPLWYHEAIPDTQKRRLVLSMNESKNEISFLQVRGGMLRPQDVLAAIHQNLVVVVAVPTTNDPEHLLASRNGNAIQRAPNENDSILPLLKIREVDDSQPLHYLGLAYVEEVNQPAKSITLNTSVTKDDIQRHTSAGHEVGLVLEKAGTDGRFGRHLLFN